MPKFVALVYFRGDLVVIAERGDVWIWRVLGGGCWELLSHGPDPREIMESRREFKVVAAGTYDHERIDCITEDGDLWSFRPATSGWCFIVSGPQC